MPSIRQDWVSILAPHDRENEIVVMALFAVLGVPPSYFDVGSGTGAMVVWVVRAVRITCSLSLMG